MGKTKAKKRQTLETNRFTFGEIGKVEEGKKTNDGRERKSNLQIGAQLLSCCLSTLLAGGSFLFLFVGAAPFEMIFFCRVPSVGLAFLSP